MATDGRKRPIVRRDQMIIWVVMAVMIFGYQFYQNRRHGDDRPPIVDPIGHQATASATAASPAIAPPAAARSAQAPSASTARPSALTRNVTLRDQDGEVIYRGEIDLAPSLERIAAGRKLRHSNDGSTFQNREGRLPKRPPGYYTEWVVPTPGESGPGPQRMVVGADGDVWYTRDHYRSFERIPGGLPAGGRESSR